MLEAKASSTVEALCPTNLVIKGGAGRDQSMTGHRSGDKKIAKLRLGPVLGLANARDEDGSSSRLRRCPLEKRLVNPLASR